MKKVFVLALDGVPFTLLNQFITNGTMPQLAALTQKGLFKQINSVEPSVSSVAWASFLTGKQPNQHGILGFAERNPATMEWFTPNASHLTLPTLLEALSVKGKSVFSMNVPATYPPKKINGISICGFLGPNLQQGTFPKKEAHFLEEQGYRIDVDTSLAKTHFPDFITDLKQVMEKRIEMMRHYWHSSDWDFFMTHIMAPDRLHHFSYELFENAHPDALVLYRSFYARIDRLIGQVKSMLDKDTTLLMLSDHGFTTLKQEVYLNRWLWENNFLHFNTPFPKSLKDIHPISKAYALYPGRIFLNLKGREKNGSVEAGEQANQVKKELSQQLLLLKWGKQPVIEKVLTAAELYPNTHSNPAVADLTAIAHRGFDLKGALWHGKLFDKSHFNGMHSYNNAFFYADEKQLFKNVTALPDIADKIKTVLLGE